MKELTGRSPMRSPGAPSLRREVQQEFWRVIATGVTSEEAANAVGVSQAVGSRWFRRGGGMPPMDLAPLTGRYLSFHEREEIAILHAQGMGVRAIARRLGRSPSTISRELRRNAATRCGKLEYRASVAQWKAELVAQRPKTAKLAANDRLREYVQDRLSGAVQARDSGEVGPEGPAWKGRNKPHRGDRRWVQGWSPEQISHRLKVEFPDDESMRISHEAIYQALYVESRGALKRELVACLRTGRALRAPRARARRKPWAHVTSEVMISERPAEVEDRAVPGHWEGDLVIGLKRSAIGTLVERTTRFTMLIHLPREDGYGAIPRTKNGPAPAGYGAVTMKNALAASMTTLPEQLRQSLTWDRGKELSQHAAFTVETDIPVYFADPKSPWQRGTNENTNGLLRQYFPKGTDLSRWSAEEIEAVATLLAFPLVGETAEYSAPTCVLKGSDDDVEDRQHDPCCASDGGRSSGVAVQAEIPNHRKLRRSRAGVVSVAVDVSLSAGQVCDEKTNVCEPLLTHRKNRRRHRNRGLWVVLGQRRALRGGPVAGELPVCGPGGVRCIGGVSSSQALAWNRRTCRLDSDGQLCWSREGEPQAADTVSGRVPMRGTGADRLVVAMRAL